MQIASLALFLLLLCCGCSPVRISARTEYISNESLASYYVGTPDPKQNNPTIGQRMIVLWRIPQEYWKWQEAELHILMRFANHQERELKIPICQNCGTYIYEILDDEFCETRGILTYKVEILSDNCLLAEWRHQLWSRLIEFKS